jgi:hypothetical protein
MVIDDRKFCRCTTSIGLCSMLLTSFVTIDSGWAGSVFCVGKESTNPRVLGMRLLLSVTAGACALVLATFLVVANIVSFSLLVYEVFTCRDSMA